ncbi:ABC transporter ATP-binding protein [Brevibacterium sp. FME37]|uniref:ABC transporter ATP-binding protein n=1 Tax=Brevibacterium sp. FME37 TaxID=2742607 RepID=UPI001867F184|nr:sn-glycerol-3-phosphate ABC transporter ATP-binding protein UgpC [Brevibacterium sp. FME37]
MVNVSLSGVGLNYPGTDRPAVSDVDLDVVDGEFLVLVGPSGCGKSTTLRMLAGLEFPSVGSILFDGEDVTDVSAKVRDVAMVFQSYALYPHMTVSENMEFALKNAGMPKAQRRDLVAEAAAMLELEDLLERKPKALSGGQRQRVAMGRAIVRRPKVFLMDEPLSNLDAKLRVQTRAQISALQSKLGVTTVYVTHDQTEAMTMGDRVVVMNEGRIEQIGTPRELYNSPATLFVAAFIGSPTMNLISATRNADGSASGSGITVPLRSDLPDSSDEIVLGVRPEDFSVTPGEGTSPLDLEISLVEELGSDTFVYGTTPNQDPLRLRDKPFVARLSKGGVPRRGERLTVHIDPTQVRVFDSQTQQLVG